MPAADPASLGVFVLAYVALQIAIGLWAARNVKTEEDYFLAGRNLGLIPIALSIFATWFGAETIMGSSGSIASEGMAGARAEPFGYAICLIAMAFLVAHSFRARGYLNLADFFRQRFDMRSELATALITVLVSTIWAAAQLVALAALLEAAVGVPQQFTLLGATAVVIVYTSLSGIAGDIYTDMIQSIVLIAGLLFVLFALAAHFGGFLPMLQQIEPEQLVFKTEDESWLGQIDTWAIPILGSLVTQEAISRFLSTKTAKLARDSTLLAGVLYFLLGMTPVIIALAGVHAFAVPENQDRFLPDIAAATLSPILYIVFTGALLSAVMSTTNSNVLSVSSMVSINLLSGVHRDASQKTRVRVARAATIGAGIAAYLIASSGQTIFDLIQLTSVWGQAGILVAVMIGLWSSYGGPRAAFWAIMACMGVNIWTLFLAPLWATLTGPEAVGLAEGLGLVLAGEAPTIEGYFLLSLLASVIAYVVGAERDKRSAKRPPPEAAAA